MKTETAKRMQAKKANEPNAGILIYALQHLGYDNYVALCDIIDNCIDADATRIKIRIRKQHDDQLQIIVADNGNGMTLESLDQALKLGSNTPHNELADLGKYGMGLSTAGLSLADRTTVITKSISDGRILESSTDADEIRQKNAFLKTLGEASEMQKAFFKAELEGEESGTIVILEQCFGVKNKNVNQFSNKIIKDIARKYRKFMDSITFYVNDEKVVPYDPLMLSGEEKAYLAERYSEDDYEISWMDHRTGEKMIGKIHVKLVLLPDTSQSKARELGINISNQGFSILRNNREIAFGVMPWHTKHPHMNRIRGEISFDASLDEAMGVNFTKNNIDMTEPVYHALESRLKPQIASMASRITMNKKVSEEEQVSHTEAAEAINKKAKVLITPPRKKQERAVSRKNKAKSNEEVSAKERQKDQQDKKHEPNVEFETMHYGKSGSIFEAEQRGKTVVIRWNVDHLFYTRFVTENQDNKTLVTSVDFLIYSLAAAQIQAIGEDDEKAIMVENIISTMSTNMKVLLS